MVQFRYGLTVKLLLSRLHIVVNLANCMSDGIEKYLIKVQERLQYKGVLIESNK